MPRMARSRAGDVLAALGALALLLAVIYLLSRVAGGARLAHYTALPGGDIVRDFVGATGWLILALLGTLALAASYALARGSGAAAEREARRAQAEVDDARRRADEARKETADTEKRLQRSEFARAASDRARRVEREWNRELREQLGRLYRARRSMVNADDVRALVLHTAVTLLGAEKGLLLERSDTGDGALTLCRSEGFENDPHEARVVKRLAERVFAQEEILREDEPGDQAGAGPADEEIENLVAIPVYVADEFAGVVVCANKEGGFHEHDDEVLVALGDHAGAVLDNSRLQADLRASYLGSVRMLAEAIEAKDSSLRGHGEEVLDLVMAVAEKLELDGAERERLMFGSLLHDVGKIGISEQILSKPGKLTPEERSAIELHPRIGFNLIQQVPGLRDVGPAVLHHHERWDGSGYPLGLAADEIPLEARIVCVADCFSAMTADRPYNRRMSVDEACIELERCARSQFDPRVVEVFVAEVRRRGTADLGEGGVLSAALADPEVAPRRGGTGLVGGPAAALTDPLTLLYSRRWLDAALRASAQRAGVRGEPFTLAVVELLDLEEINRARGFDGGDSALIVVAQAAQRAASKTGGAAARFSGRRFALVLPGAGPGPQAAIAELARELEDGALHARCGAAVWQAGATAEDLLGRAREGALAPPV